MVPYRLLPELRKYSDSVITPGPATAKVMETKYTNAVPDLAQLAHVIKTELTPTLGDYSETFDDDLDF